MWSLLVYPNRSWISLYNLEVTAYRIVFVYPCIWINGYFCSSSPDSFIQIDHIWYQTIGFSSRDNAWSSLLSVRTTSHCCVGLLQGMTLPSVGGIRFANERRRQGGQQTVRDLAANVWIFLYNATAASLPNLGITRTHPFPVYSPAHPHCDDPSK